MIPDELNIDVLVALYQKLNTPTSGLAKFFPNVGSPTAGEHINYDVLEFTRGMARTAARWGPPQPRTMPIRSRVAYKGITLKEDLKIPGELWKDAAAPGSMTEPAREACVTRAMQTLRNNFDARLEWLRAQWLTGGALLSSAGVVPTTAASIDGTVYVDYPDAPDTAPLGVSLGFSTDHIDLAVGASWATAGTDILTDLETAREKIGADSGVYADTIICNAKVMGYLRKNTAVARSETFKYQIDSTGAFSQLWGFNVVQYDGIFAVDPDTTASAAGSQKYIPDDLVILLSSDNIASGRSMYECEPSDFRASTADRGVFPWRDEDPVHPHIPTVGMEWTGGPVIAIPDSIYVYVNVTQT